jgi:Leucine-rich repeat (LRR) protein
VHLDSLIPHLDSINPKYIWLRAKNKIRTFPVQIGTMTNLEELTLAFNEIETIPASIGQLKNLKKLNLQFNKIKTLPPELYTLTQLKELYTLTQLQEINLQNNLLDMKAILELKKHLPNTKIIIKDND